jgi:hypothetical protein
MKTFLLALLVGCTPAGITTSAEHPANPNAPVGRLAGPPAALRPGVADVLTPTPPTTTPPPAEHVGHEQPAPEPAPATEAPPKPEKPKQPAPKKPTPKKPAPKPDQPAPAPEHQGHEGHH